MKKYLTFLRTVLIIWMPKCIQERIEDTQIAWERLRNDKKSEQIAKKLSALQDKTGTISEEIDVFFKLPPAKKKAAKKKVARKKRVIMIPKIKVAEAIEEIGKEFQKFTENTKSEPIINLEAKPKRIRRSKEQIEADRQAKEQGAQP